MLKVIELFSGIGTQREALRRADIPCEIVATSEIDKYASQAYELLHGKTNNMGDITKIERLPKADLWTYSFPCTDISIAGKLGGFRTRNKHTLKFAVGGSKTTKNRTRKQRITAISHYGKR